MVRYAHLIVIILGLIILSIEKVKSNVSDLEERKLKVKYLSGISLFAQCLEVVQVVVYQASIFNAQWLTGALSQLGESREQFKDYDYESWLVIEICSFYMIVLGAVIYIASSMISTMIWPDQLKDEEVSRRDFITYNVRSITWYAFNTILIGIPFALLIMDHYNPRNQEG